MGNPALADDPLFATRAKRKENEAALDELIAQWTRGFEAYELMHKLQKAGLAAGVSSTSQDLFANDPQLAHRRFFHKLAHAEIGPHHYPAPPVRLSNTPHDLVSAAPVIGEHNEYVLTEILGFSEEEFVELMLAGALE
jgi:crotonobetainyl-CoA:carnitine CoA-transferase CaiB-like acyl-CoA transferase